MAIVFEAGGGSPGFNLADALRAALAAGNPPWSAVVVAVQQQAVAFEAAFGSEVVTN